MVYGLFKGILKFMTAATKHIRKTGTNPVLYNEVYTIKRNIGCKNVSKHFTTPKGVFDSTTLEKSRVDFVHDFSAIFYQTLQKCNNLSLN